MSLDEQAVETAMQREAYWGLQQFEIIELCERTVVEKGGRGEMGPTLACNRLLGCLMLCFAYCLTADSSSKDLQAQSLLLPPCPLFQIA